MSYLNPPAGSESISCSYHNRSGQTRLVRTANTSHWYFEGMVHPGQKLRFLAPADACLEVYVGEEVKGSPVERIACSRL